MSGGQSGAKGYLLQALICVLDSLESNDDWDTVTFEPNDESDKVDVRWTCGNEKRVVQVKHSSNRIGVADANRWAKELEESVSATTYELRLLGPVADGVPPKGNQIGRVRIPTPEIINLNGLRKQAAHNLDLYLTNDTSRVSLRPIVREVIVEALSNRIGGMSTDGATFAREELNKLLDQWIKEILRQAGLEAPSTISNSSRISRLEMMLSKCHGRCVARWQAGGLLRDVATSLAADQTVGDIDQQWLPTHEQPVRLLIGPLGAGKSLAAERFVESNIRNCISDESAPLPVFLTATHLSGALEDAIKAACAGLGDPAILGVRLVVDSLDELSSRDAQNILNEARALTHAWAGTYVVLTSRPSRCWNGVEESVSVPRLESERSLNIVALAAGATVADVERMAFAWSVDLLQAIRVPLFALLLGKYIRDGKGSGYVSQSVLVAHLVESAVNDTLLAAGDLKERLQSLAIQCLDDGGAVRLTELEPIEEREAVLRSGLVTENEGLVSFPLPLLTQWFAGRALASERVDVDSLWREPGRIDKWRSAIAIAVGTGSEQLAERILTPIAKRDPGFLLTIVDEVTTNWTVDDGAAATNSLNAACRIRNAMKACVSGIGHLAAVITPINPSTGGLFRTDARADGEWIIAGWNMDQSANDETGILPNQVALPGPMQAGDQVLPGHEEMLGFRSGFVRPYWRDVCGARPGKQSAWAWRWVAEHLQVLLKARLTPGGLLDHFVDRLVEETAWHTATEVLNCGGLHYTPIPIDELLKALPVTLEELADRSRANHRTLIKPSWWEIDVTALGLELPRLLECGKSEICHPLPTPDLLPSKSITHYLPWESYSEPKLFDRLQAVVSNALEAYVQFVDYWFKPLAARLNRATTLPAEIRVDVDLKPGCVGLESEPMLRIYWIPLPAEDSTRVTVCHGEVTFGGFDPQIGRRLHAEAQKHRPQFAESIGIVLSSCRAFDFFADHAVQKLTYRWLEEDLSRIAWIH